MSCLSFSLTLALIKKEHYALHHGKESVLNSENHKNISVERTKKFWLAKGIISTAAMLSMAFSIFLYYSGDNLNAIYVGLWVPSILAGGVLLMVGHSG